MEHFEEQATLQWQNVNPRLAGKWNFFAAVLWSDMLHAGLNHVAAAGALLCCWYQEKTSDEEKLV